MQNQELMTYTQCSEQAIEESKTVRRMAATSSVVVYETQINYQLLSRLVCDSIHTRSYRFNSAMRFRDDTHRQETMRYLLEPQIGLLSMSSFYSPSLRLISISGACLYPQPF